MCIRDRLYASEVTKFGKSAFFCMPTCIVQRLVARNWSRVKNNRIVVRKLSFVVQDTLNFPTSMWVAINQ